MTATTVIIPVRDGAATIASALGSTLRALPRDGRVVVHDDASTDGTGRVLATFRDPRVTVLRSEEPRGVAGGLNLLLAHVSTPQVARMDADDVVLPWRFARQQAALDRGADVVFSTVLPFGPPLHRLRPGPPVPISAEAMPLHLVLANPVAHSTMLARTATLTAAGGYRAVAAEDYDLWLRLVAAGARIVRTAVPTLLYRVHPGQVTAGAGWAERALADPAVVAARAAVGDRALGAVPGDGEELLRDPARLAGAVREAAGRLPWLQRELLWRKVSALAGSTVTSRDGVTPA